VIDPRIGRAAVTLAMPLVLAAAAPSPTGRDAQFDALTASVKAEMQSDPEDAVSRSRTALAYARRAKSPQMEVTALWLMGEAYSRIVQHQRAAEILGQASRLAKKTVPGTQLYADVLLSEGGALYTVGQIGRALSDLRRAHDMFRDLGDTRSRAKSLIMIALVYATANDHESALKYFGQAIDVYRADPGLSVAIYNGRGIALRELKRYAAAEAELVKGLALAREMKSPFIYAQILTNVADVRLARNNLAGAQRAINEGLALSAKPEAAAHRSGFVSLAAQAAFQRGDIVAAERLIAQRFAGENLTKTLPPDRSAHDIAYQIYTKLGRTDLAIKHLAALKRLDDQATDIARSNSAAIASAQFDFANQELRIAQLKAADLQKTIAFERARARTQQWMFLGTLLIIAMLIVGIVMIRRSRNALARTNTALAKALAAKTEFLATTSHEIRTPLNGILGMTQVMLADAKVDPPTRERLSVVHGAGMTMRALVDDILDVAKIETGRMTIEQAPTDIRRTITDAARIWEEQARHKQLGFTLDLDNAPGWAIADATRLRQIIFNLLSNAVKFTATGHVSVAAEVLGDRWRLVVADTGIGIAPDKHDVIFEAFRQADTGTTRQFGGTGLGLSICRNLSRAMGGDVTVESNEGEGATFVLDLPYESAASDEAVATPGSGVLVVDHNPITRAMFKALLAPVGGAVTFAATGEEAAEVVESQPPATILIDDATLRTSDDPVAAVRALAGRAPAARIALLGPAIDPAEQAMLCDAGVSRFITKPIGKDALVQALFSDEPVACTLVSQAA
jgi:signal transduction histidine kinase/ActR/RegA family two-component response regulator